MTPTPLSLSIFGNDKQGAMASRIADFVAALEHAGIAVAVDEAFHRYLALPASVATIPPDAPVRSDMALSIGGDGTFLRTARRIGSSGVPVAGVNTGHLGYLTAFTLDAVPQLIDDLICRRFTIEKRSLIEVVVVGDPADSSRLPSRFALNEVAILRDGAASMITVDADINSHRLCSYPGDGLIVATPTGSTGYNLSVGGPILDPASPTWAVSPIAVHSLTMRPLVVRDDSEMVLSVRSRNDRFTVSVDGTSASFPNTTRVILRKASFSIRLVQQPGHTFSDTLRSKLGWGT